MREAIRVRHFSLRTEEAYVGWIRRFILFHRRRHPRDMGEVQAFLNDLAVRREVSPSTQTQALNALVFLYRHVLGRPLGEMGEPVRPKRKRRLPVVPTVGEVARILRALERTALADRVPALRPTSSRCRFAGIAVFPALAVRARFKPAELLSVTRQGLHKKLERWPEMLRKRNDVWS